MISATSDDTTSSEGTRLDSNQRLNVEASGTDAGDPSPMSVDLCEHGYNVDSTRDDDGTTPVSRSEEMDVENVLESTGLRYNDEAMDVEVIDGKHGDEYQQKNASNKQCLPLRAALLKSILNFLKKAMPEPAFSDNIRGLMDTSLPKSLKHMISNATYYGASLFLSATDVVAVYIFQEPTVLSVLQNNGLSSIIIKALIEKEVPATREVLSSLPNVLGALCLNSRGLEQLVKIKPFRRLFRVLVSEEYLPAMRRRRSSDQPGDTAFNLGVAMDEFMRHQPSIRNDAMNAIIELIKELASLGSDDQYSCLTSPSKNIPDNGQESRSRNADVSSDEEDETDNTSSVAIMSRDIGDKDDVQKRKSIPLLDYIFNVAKFLESIIGNHRIDDHCHDFIRQNGLAPLMELFALPNLPLEYPTTTPCQSVSQVAKDIMNLSRDGSVLRTAFTAFKKILVNLQECPTSTCTSGSMLLKELSCCNNLETAAESFKTTPILHYLSSASSYVNMLTQVCRTGQVIKN